MFKVGDYIIDKSTGKKARVGVIVEGRDTHTLGAYYMVRWVDPPGLYSKSIAWEDHMERFEEPEPNWEV